MLTTFETTWGFSCTPHASNGSDSGLVILHLSLAAYIRRSIDLRSIYLSTHPPIYLSIYPATYVYIYIRHIPNDLHILLVQLSRFRTRWEQQHTAHMYMHMYLHIYIYICICVCIYVYIYVCMHVCMQVHDRAPRAFAHGLYTYPHYTFTLWNTSSNSHGHSNSNSNNNTVLALREAQEEEYLMTETWTLLLLLDSMTCQPQNLVRTLRPQKALCKAGSPLLDAGREA